MKGVGVDTGRPSVRYRAPLKGEQIKDVVALLKELQSRLGPKSCESDPRFRQLLKILRAHVRPLPGSEFTFAQLNALRLQIIIYQYLRKREPLPTALMEALESGLTIGKPIEMPNAKEEMSLTDGVPAVEHPFLLSPETRLPLRKADATQTKLAAFDHSLLVEERDRILEDYAEKEKKWRQLGETDTRRREIDQLQLQLKYRAEMSKEHAVADKEGRFGSRNRERALRALQRDFERVDRIRSKNRELEEREKRQAKTAWLNGLLEHLGAFRAYHRDTVKRQFRMINKYVMKYHEDVARIADKAEREAERKRIQKLREDDEEGYLQLVRETKNARLMELINQTDSYLKELGVTLKQERVNSGMAVDEDDDHDDGRKYHEIAHAKEEKITEQPKLLEFGKLKEYQRQGLQWMVSLYNNRLNGILADEMGLGKTVQTIALICYLVEKKDNPGPYMIILPLSTMNNWEMEFARWAPKLKVLVFTGDQKNRRHLFENVLKKGEVNVVLVTYEYVLRGKNALRQIEWQYIIIDEGHRIKNHASKLSNILAQQYGSRNRLLLTGTPLQNSLGELWALLNFLLPKVFHNCETFEGWFAAPFENMPEGDETPKALNEEESLLIIRRLHQVLRPFLLRRLKSDVLKMGEQLPSKQEDILFCDMSGWQKLTYKSIVRNERLVFTNTRGRQCYDRLSSPVMQLRKIVNHPYLFHHEYSQTVEDGPELWRASGKFDMLDSCILKLLKGNHRILVFNQMTKVLELQERVLRYRGIPYLRLDGSTKPEDRSALVKEFNDPNTIYNVFLLTTRAGGLGVNLQTADTVIIFDSDWNPQMDLQAADRAHRIGQRREVRIIRFITARSVEEDVLERASFKRGLEQKIITAGMFDEKSKDSERQARLREVLREEEHANEDEKEGIPTEIEVNRILARGDHEIELFEEVDRERKKEIEGLPRLMEEDEVMGWIVHPDLDMFPHTRDELAKERQGEGEWEELGPRRAAQKGKAMYATDRLTDSQYLKMLDEGRNPEEVMVRRKRKNEAKQELTATDEPIAKKSRKLITAEEKAGGESDLESGETGSNSITSSPGTGLKMLAPEQEESSTTVLDTGHRKRKSLSISSGEVSEGAEEESLIEATEKSKEEADENDAMNGQGDGEDDAERDDEEEEEEDEGAISDRTEEIEIEEMDEDDSDGQKDMANAENDGSGAEDDVSGAEEGEVEESEVNNDEDESVAIEDSEVVGGDEEEIEEGEEVEDGEGMEGGEEMGEGVEDGEEMEEGEDDNSGHPFKENDSEVDDEDREEEEGIGEDGGDLYKDSGDKDEDEGEEEEEGNENADGDEEGAEYDSNDEGRSTSPHGSPQEDGADYEDSFF